MKFGRSKAPTPQITHTWSESEEKEREEAVAMETLIPDMLRWRFVLPAAHTIESVREREKERDVDKHKQDNVVNL